MTKSPGQPFETFCVIGPIHSQEQTFGKLFFHLEDIFSNSHTVLHKISELGKLDGALLLLVSLGNGVPHVEQDADAVRVVAEVIFQDLFLAHALADRNIGELSLVEDVQQDVVAFFLHELGLRVAVSTRKLLESHVRDGLNLEHVAVEELIS